MKRIQKILAIVFTFVFAFAVVSPAFAAEDYTENPNFVKLTASEIDAKYNSGASFIVMLYLESCSNCNYLGNNVVANWMNDYDRTVYGLDLGQGGAFPQFVLNEYGTEISTPIIAFVSNSSHESFMGYNDSTVSALNNKFYDFYGITPVKKISSISIETLPAKTEYTVGEAFSSEGLQLKITYTDSTTETVSNGFSCTAPDMNSVGTKNVVVTYGGKAVIFNIQINEAPTTTKPAETTTKPAETTTKPAETTTKPAETTTKPAETTTKPAETTTKPAETTTKPAPITTKPAETTTKPAETTTKPVSPVPADIILSPSVFVINYGDALVLHVDKTKIPEGGYVVWSASSDCFEYTVTENGNKCTVEPSKSGNTTFTATVYGADKKPVASDEETLTSKAGFFQKLIAFFKQLFGATKVYDENMPA